MTPITKKAVESRLRTAVFGHPLQVEDRLASTNGTLLDMARQGAPEGTTLIARQQTGGRGRRGRSFFSPEGGLYLSTLLRPKKPVDPGLITSCAAVAAARAIEDLCPLTVGIKWVNDLFIGGKKVCGILAQGQLDAAGQLAGVVLGFGINAAPQVLPPEIAAIATTLGNEGAPVEPAMLAAALLNRWEAAYGELDSRRFLEENRRRSVVLGRRVQVLRGSESFPAVAAAITEEGHLLVQTADGPMELHSGEVSLRL